MKNEIISNIRGMKDPRIISCFFLLGFVILFLNRYLDGKLSFCINNTNTTCRQCPPNSKCNKTSFECDEGTFTDGYHCFLLKRSKKDIENLHTRIFNMYKGNTTITVDDLIKIYKKKYTENDIKSAIIYLNRLKIKGKKISTVVLPDFTGFYHSFNWYYVSTFLFALANTMLAYDIMEWVIDVRKKHKPTDKYID